VAVSGEDPKLISLANGSAARVSRALNCSSGTDSLLPTFHLDVTNLAHKGQLKTTGNFFQLLGTCPAARQPSCSSTKDGAWTRSSA